MMRSDKMPTRREGEASSNTAVCPAKTAKKAACWGRWRLILAHDDTCALGNRRLWNAQTRPKRPRVVRVVGGDSSKKRLVAPLSDSPMSCRASHSPARHVVETRGRGTFRTEKPLPRIHLLSDRRRARVTHRALFFFLLRNLSLIHI